MRATDEIIFMKKIVLAFLLAILAGGIQAQNQGMLRMKQFNLNGGLAISGYDPVAYFVQNKAVKGNKDHAVVYDGITYYFSSAANREAFKKNPANYEPAYGGWCSYAMGAKGEKVEIDPTTFKIVNGRLNLFYNRFFNNTLTDWNKDETNLEKQAAANWSKIFH